MEDTTTTKLLMLVSKVLDIQTNTTYPTYISLNNAAGVMSIGIGNYNQTTIDFNDCIMYEVVFYSYDFEHPSFNDQFSVIFERLCQIEKDFILF